jgi:PPE-repeat protein
MSFITLPPEITSALIHSGPGAGSWLVASRAWERLGTDLEDSIRDYAPVLSALTEAWRGPSAAAMTQAVGPYVTWLRTTAQQCQQLSLSAQVAAAAFGSTLVSVVHPSVVTANRAQLVHLLATNAFGMNLPAIAATEAQYQVMWANNSSAIFRYQAASAQALPVSQFTSPPTITTATGAAAQASAVSTTTTTTAAPTTASILSSIQSELSSLIAEPIIQNGWFQLANTYANQFISSGFPINLLSYAAQNTSAQALQTVAPEIGTGLSEGESALGTATASLSSAVQALGGVSAPTAAIGAGIKIGNLMAPPAVVGLLPAAQTPVQLASAVSPLPAADSGFPLPPLMPPPISSAGSGWRKRKPQKYEDVAYGMEVKGTVMPQPPSAG